MIASLYPTLIAPREANSLTQTSLSEEALGGRALSDCWCRPRACPGQARQRRPAMQKSITDKGGYLGR